jgi:hypothetical protein
MNSKQKFKVGDLVQVSGDGLSDTELKAEELIGERGIVVGVRHNNQEGDLRYEEVIVHLANPSEITLRLFGGRIWFKKNRLKLLAKAKQ